MRAEDAGEDRPDAPPVEALAVQSSEVIGFNNAGLEAHAEDHVALAAVARERYQMEAMVAMARLNPRNELASFQAMVNAAKRPTFAAKAEYRYSRGGKPVVGVSVAATRPLASYWGHIRSGWKILRLDEDGYHIEGFAHDMQTGSMRSGEHVGQWVQQRKNRDTGKAEWITVTDERDRRELMGKQGSILERNCVLAIIPPDIVEDVIAECRRTNTAQASGDLKKDRASTIRAMAAALGEFGVTPEMVERRIGHPIEAVSAEEIADLRTIYNSMKEGEPMLSFFEVTARAAPQTVKIDLSKAVPAPGQDPKGGATIGDVSKPKAKPAPKQETLGEGPAA